MKLVKIQFNLHSEILISLKEALLVIGEATIAIACHFICFSRETALSLVLLELPRQKVFVISECWVMFKTAAVFAAPAIFEHAGKTACLHGWKVTAGRGQVTSGVSLVVTVAQAILSFVKYVISTLLLVTIHPVFTLILKLLLRNR